MVKGAEQERNYRVPPQGFIFNMFAVLRDVAEVGPL